MEYHPSNHAPPYYDSGFKLLEKKLESILYMPGTSCPLAPDRLYSSCVSVRSQAGASPATTLPAPDPGNVVAPLAGARNAGDQETAARQRVARDRVARDRVPGTRVPGTRAPG